jgi:hypothetical protein
VNILNYQTEPAMQAAIAGKERAEFWTGLTRFTGLWEKDFDRRNMKKRSETREYLPHVHVIHVSPV